MPHLNIHLERGYVNKCVECGMRTLVTYNRQINERNRKVHWRKKNLLYSNMKFRFPRQRILSALWNCRFYSNCCIRIMDCKRTNKRNWEGNKQKKHNFKIFIFFKKTKIMTVIRNDFNILKMDCFRELMISANCKYIYSKSLQHK